MTRPLLGAAGVAALLIAGSSAAPQTVYRAGGDVKAPALESSNQPEYSDAARMARLQGTVLVSLVVGEDGHPRDLKVTKPLGLGLDEAALTTVGEWRFRPGTKAGQPVPVMTTVEVSYRLLLNPHDWRVVKAGFDVPPNVSSAVLTRALYHVVKGTPPQATVKVAFDIDIQGVPKNIHIENSSDAKANGEAISLVRAWRFHPATQGGQPVPSKAWLELRRGPEPK